LLAATDLGLDFEDVQRFVFVMVRMERCSTLRLRGFGQDGERAVGLLARDPSYARAPISTSVRLVMRNLSRAKQSHPARRRPYVPDYTEINLKAYRELDERFMHALREIDCAQQLIPCRAYLRKQIPLQGEAHQVGTCRFGTDPADSVLDPNAASTRLIISNF
jgi:choline dehydrogenase-like flavoprotein